MNQKATVAARSISPLVVSDGFVYGWAFDPLRPVVAVALYVDGLECQTGLTGHAVADSFYAVVPPPPNIRCGFSLPLPQHALDGRVHKLIVKVRDWQALHSAPFADIKWHHGPCFGEVKQDSRGYFEGWVGFRKALSDSKIPPVVVSDGSEARFAISPTLDPGRSVDGAATMAHFRVAQRQLSDMDKPTFSCLGRQLQLKKPPPTCKAIGRVEQLDFDGIRGWILNAANPRESLDVVLVIDDQPYMVFRPNVLRPGIAREIKLLPEEIGICGFSISLPPVLKDGREHTVSLKCKVDGTLLNSSPLKYRHIAAGISLAQARALLQNPAVRNPSVQNSSALKLSVQKLSMQKTAVKKSGGAVQAGTAKRPSHKAPRVTAVVLNRNGAACLDKLFASLLQHNSVPLELIVIDHASSDNSLGVVQQWQHALSIRVEALDDNYSFSASCNRGARLASAPFVLFLNNDIVWLQDALQGMLDSLKVADTGVVGLKLLKTEFVQDESDLQLEAKPDVQHLGVRFTLVDSWYYPFEVKPDTAPVQTQYSPQHLPVVTGAVMLCRTEQFLAAGGFDEGYVYGYEDVELCLRMAQRHGLRSICRNDLVALHHHGYTRLTGREPGMIDHQVNNQQRLGGQLGLWIKRFFWQSLLDGDGLLSTEVLTIGFAVDACLKPASDNGQLAAALHMAEALMALYPHCKTLFLNSDSNWDHVGDCHVLVVLSPEYDLRTVKQARADLRTAVYLYEPALAERWLANPGLALFDLCVHPDTREARAACIPGMMLALAPVLPQAPLGDLLASNRLRVLLRTATVPASLRQVSVASARTSALGQASVASLADHMADFADKLLITLKTQGAIASVEQLGKPAKGATVERSRVVDVQITVFDRAVVESNQGFFYERQADVINVLWIVEAAEELRPRDLEQADQVWLGSEALPASLAKAARVQRKVGQDRKSLQGVLRHLLKSVDDKISRTFKGP